MQQPIGKVRRAEFVHAAAIGIVQLLVSPCAARDFIAGVDISALPTFEAAGAHYLDNGVQGNALEILSANAANYARIRLFVDPDPDAGDRTVAQDVPYAIALAQRAKATGMNVLLDFMYSDTWADPGNQTKPAAWQGLNFDALKQQVYDYSRDVIEQFDAAGALPDMVQIGNEINSGMIWQDGRLFRPDLSEAEEFDNLAALMSQGIRGVRDAAGAGREPQIVIHHSRGDSVGQTSFWLDRLLPRLQANGTDVDVIGYSYYPLFHSDNIANVQQTLNNTVATYGKPVAIVETGFAYACPTCEPDYPWDVSPEGQHEFLQDVVNAVLAVPNEMGLGVFWWFAEATNHDQSGIMVWQNARYGLFDANGELLPAIQTYVNLPRQAGDVDEDGDVDMDDYATIRDHFGAQNFPAGVFRRQYGDLNLDGVVDLHDYHEWKNMFPLLSAGDSGLVGGSAPEPNSMILVGMSMLVAFGHGRDARAFCNRRLQNLML